jgi:hypothetical protein
MLPCGECPLKIHLSYHAFSYYTWRFTERSIPGIHATAWHAALEWFPIRQHCEITMKLWQFFLGAAVD